MTKRVSPIRTICARKFDMLIKLMMMMIVITSIQNCIDTLKPFGSREVFVKDCQRNYRKKLKLHGKRDFSLEGVLVGPSAKNTEVLCYLNPYHLVCLTNSSDTRRRRGAKLLQVNK